MTVEVHEVVRSQADDHRSIRNLHDISLDEALVKPERVSIIVRTVHDGRVKDEKESVWLVAREPGKDGYRVVMHDDGYFGLASHGFPSDPNPILVGYYGDLLTTFMAM